MHDPATTHRCPSSGRRALGALVVCVLMLLTLLGAACDEQDEGGSFELPGIPEPHFDDDLARQLRDLTRAFLMSESIPGAAVLARDRHGAVWAAGVGMAVLDSDGLPEADPTLPDARSLLWSDLEGLAFLAGPGAAPEAAVVALPTDPAPDAGHKMTAEHLLRIASLTKPLVATLVLQQVDRGVLALSDTVARWLGPVIPTADTVTLKMLLSHTSGLADYGSDPLFLFQVLAEPGRVWAPQELVDWAVAKGPACEPGACYRYSSANFVLLGMVLEAATGLPYQELLLRDVVRPLGLTRMQAVRGVGLPPGAAHGYLSIAGQRDVTDIDASAGFASGDVVADVVELERAFAAVLSGELLSPASRAAMFDFQPTGEVALEVGLGIFNRQQTVFHSGMVIGYQASMQARNGVRVVVLTNATPPVQRIAENMAEKLAATILLNVEGWTTTTGEDAP